MGGAWGHGVEVDWESLYGGLRLRSCPSCRLILSNAAYWLDSPGSNDAAAVGQAPVEHPLLGAAVSMADDSGWLFTGRLSTADPPMAFRSRVMGSVTLPGTALLELARYAGSRVGCGGCTS